MNSCKKTYDRTSNGKSRNFLSFCNFVHSIFPMTLSLQECASSTGQNVIINKHVSLLHILMTNRVTQLHSAKIDVQDDDNVHMFYCVGNAHLCTLDEYKMMMTQLMIQPKRVTFPFPQNEHLLTVYTHIATLSTLSIPCQLTSLMRNNTRRKESNEKRSGDRI